ncbi:hypothetical protein RLPCCGM1_c2050 [Rhizobium leguminosarum bv. phaseoli CCGM1]|nr:hypothetical protein RLPCCGM1_c2050 [Rhizobium leguminosarum bv. phaseoli CCGM1]
MFDGGGAQIANSLHELSMRAGFTDRMGDCFEMSERAYDTLDGS